MEPSVTLQLDPCTRVYEVPAMSLSGLTDVLVP